jgi:hypothetical protein
MNDLQPLESLKRVKQLTLCISDPVNNLQKLEQAKELTHLTLSFRNSEVIDLQPVRNLNSLQILSIQDATRTERMSLRHIPASLVELTF